MRPTPETGFMLLMSSLLLLRDGAVVWNLSVFHARNIGTIVRMTRGPVSSKLQPVLVLVVVRL